MFVNFLRIAIRQFTRHKVYTLINVLGLSLGLGCFILLALFVHKEITFDDFQTNKGQVYQLFRADSAKVNGPFSNHTEPLMGPTLLEELPDIINFTRFGEAARMRVVTVSKSFEIQDLYFTDIGSFEMFDFDMLAGSAPVEVFHENQILISESEAMKLYGNVNAAIGQIIEFNNYEDFQVIGVYKDQPINSHLAFNALISFDHVNDNALYGIPEEIEIDMLKWNVIAAFVTYVMLEKEADIDIISEKAESIFAPHVFVKEEHKLIRLDNIYLSEWNTGYFKQSGNVKELKLFIGVGLLLLIIAIVNYMNLSTARFSKRAKEVGVRKTIGGHRNQLIYQFLIESLTITFVALIIGVVFAEIAMPFFNNYTGKEIGLSYDSAQTYLFLLLTTLLIGLFSGAYPAFYLSGFSAKYSQFKNYRGSDRGTIRKVLVGIQFAVCLGLITSTYILFSQYQHINDIDKGVNTEQLIMITLNSEVVVKSVFGIQDEVRRIPNVLEVKSSRENPFEDYVPDTYINTGEGGFRTAYFAVEPGLLEMLEIGLAKGSLISDLPMSDQKGVCLVNETFVRKMGWDNPIGKKLNGRRKIVGVVNDFVFESPKKEIKPVMIWAINKSAEYPALYIYARLNGDIGNTVDEIEKKMLAFDPLYQFEYQFLDEFYAAKYEEEKRLSEVFGVFSVFTIFIAALGILGLSIFVAESRVKEIGIRKVLGANIGQLVWLLNGGITALVLVVALITLPAVFYFTSGWLEGFAFRIELNAIHFILPMVILLCILWSILLYHAYKSANANPVNALRME